jgi:hypothetical protein
MDESAPAVASFAASTMNATEVSGRARDCERSLNSAPLRLGKWSP